MPRTLGFGVSHGSDIVGFGRAARFGCGFLTPPPAADLRYVVAMTRDVLSVLDELIADGLFGIGRAGAGLWHAIDDIADQVKAIDVVHHAHVKRRAGGSFLLISADMKVFVAVTAVSQPMNEPRVAVEGED